MAMISCDHGGPTLAAVENGECRGCGHLCGPASGLMLCTADGDLPCCKAYALECRIQGHAPLMKNYRRRGNSMWGEYYGTREVVESPMKGMLAAKSRQIGNSHILGIALADAKPGDLVPVLMRI